MLDLRIVLGGGGGGITVEFLQKTQVFCFRAQELQLFTSRGGETAVVSPVDGWEQTLESTVFEDAGSHLPEVRGHLLGSLPDSSLSTKGYRCSKPSTGRQSHLVSSGRGRGKKNW